MLKRYRIIKPYFSDKIVEASSLKKGAKSCYKDIKSTNTISSEFAIKDIDTNEVYRYKINKIQLGGTVPDPIGVPVDDAPTAGPTMDEPVAAPIEPTIQAGNNDHEVAKLAIMVADLTTKIGKLERQISNCQQMISSVPNSGANVYDINASRLAAYRALQKPNQVDDSCSIM